MTSINARRRNAAAAKWAKSILDCKPPRVCNELHRKLVAAEQRLFKNQKGE